MDNDFLVNRNDKESNISNDQDKIDEKCIFDIFLETINNDIDKSNDTTIRNRRLPGFLFPDGISKVVVENEATNISSYQESAMFSATFGTASEECDRLTLSEILNPYEILRVPVNVLDEDLKRAYRKISLLIHPDKCDHAKAQHAFNIVVKAYEELQKPEMKDKYKHVYEEAKKRVMKEVSKNKKSHNKNKRSHSVIDTADIQEKITATCEVLLKEMNENIAYAEKCRKANENYEKEQADALVEEERNEELKKKKWEETRDIRVECWRDFKDDIATKRLKLSSFVPIAHKREQRKPGDKSVSSKPRGIDESYKENWR